MIYYCPNYYGISGKAKLLLESYIQNRYQRVHITNSYLNSNAVSKWTKIKYGVLQSSILGQLLFLVYTNDLPRAVECKALPILFADDISILLTSPNVQMHSDLNFVFEQLNKWFESNQLFFNFDKTCFIEFSNKSKCTSDKQITYEDKQLSLANETKLLGLFINNNLSWKTHIEYIKSKLSSSCYVMSLVRPSVTVNTLRMIYYSYFHSVMTYGLLFWGELPTQYNDFRVTKEDF